MLDSRHLASVVAQNACLLFCFYVFLTCVVQLHIAIGTHCLKGWDGIIAKWQITHTHTRNDGFQNLLKCVYASVTTQAV